MLIRTYAPARAANYDQSSSTLRPRGPSNPLLASLHLDSSVVSDTACSVSSDRSPKDDGYPPSSYHVYGAFFVCSVSSPTAWSVSSRHHPFSERPHRPVTSSYPIRPVSLTSRPSCHNPRSQQSLLQLTKLSSNSTQTGSMR